MSPLGQLLALLAGLLAVESLLWVRRGAFVACAQWPAPFRLLQPSGSLGTARAGFVLGSPLPLGEAFGCEEWLLSLSPEGVLGATGLGLHPDGRPERTARFLTWEDAPAFRAEGCLVLAGRTVLVATQADSVATELAGLLAEVAALDPERREARIRQAVGRRFDRAACAMRLAAGRRASRRTRPWSVLLALVVFVGLPVADATVGLLPAWPFLLGATVLLVTATALAVRRGHAELHAGSAFLRRRAVALTLLLPTTAMRARDLLDRDLLAGFHPLVVAAATCRPHEALRWAGAFLRDAREPERPACPLENPVARRVEAWHRGIVAARLEQLVEELGLEAASFFLPGPGGPGREGGGSDCPRCLARYTLTSGTCRDCAGVPLVQRAR